MIKNNGTDYLFKFVTLPRTLPNCTCAYNFSLGRNNRLQVNPKTERYTITTATTTEIWGKAKGL
jgi:hypothetical protein